MILFFSDALGLSLVFEGSSGSITMKCLSRFQLDLNDHIFIYLRMSDLDASILEVNMSECLSLIFYLNFQIFIFISLFYFLF